MAQSRYTGLSMGGPTYINDPRVDEAVALGQLLQQHQAAASAQADRLFARQQDVAQFDERRRQFDEEQKRLASAAKMQQADSDRQFGLAQQQEQTRAALAQQGQAGDAEDRLFRRAEAERSGQQFQTEQQRLRDAEIGRERESMDARYTTIDENRKAREADALKEIDRFYAQRGLEVGRDQRAEKAQRGAEERQAQRDAAAFKRAQADRDAERAKEERKTEAERVRETGNEGDRREAAKAARAARFQAALEAATKEPVTSDADQAKAVRRAYQEATQPDLDPQKTTREKLDLGPEGEAQSNDDLAKIVDDFFPNKTRLKPVISDTESERRLRESPIGSVYDPQVIENTLTDLANTYGPEWLRALVARGKGFNAAPGPSGGQAEAERLFKRK